MQNQFTFFPLQFIPNKLPAAVSHLSAIKWISIAKEHYELEIHSLFLGLNNAIK